MKKRIVIPVIIIIALALILFFPVPIGTYDDGGTREYAALTYKIVIWNCYFIEIDENGQGMGYTYHKTSVYWYPDNQKKYGELWQMEMADN